MAGFLKASSAEAPANDPDFPLPPSPAAGGASHPDEPRPLFGDPEPAAKASGYEPKDLMFPDDSSSTKVRPVPNDAFSPKPLFADEPQSPPASRPAAPSVPGALRFDDTPTPQVLAQPAAPVRTPATEGVRSTLNFPNAPAAPATPGSHGLFESTESPLIKRGIELAQQRYPQLWAEDGGATFQRHLRQLLPLDRSAIDAWGSAVLDRVAETANATASVTRTFLALQANETLNQALQDARAPAPNVWQRMVKPPVSLDACRLRLKNLREAMAPLLEQTDRCEKDARAAAQRLARDLASLSVVTTVSGAISNNGMAHSLDDRSALLATSLRQAELLPGQLKNLGDQMRELNRQVDEALSVTFPALALARAARG